MFLGGGAGFYMSIYVIRFTLIHLDADFLGSEMIYMVYIAMFINGFALMIGAISVVSSFYFI